jgi:hypothetical protein
MMTCASNDVPAASFRECGARCKNGSSPNISVSFPYRFDDTVPLGITSMFLVQAQSLVRRLACAQHPVAPLRLGA